MHLKLSCIFVWMKKCRSYLFILFGTVWAVSAFSIGRFPNWFLPFHFCFWKKTLEIASDQKGNHFDTLVLGDARTGMGLMPLAISRNAFSFALPYETPVEAYYLLKKYLMNHPPPKVLLVAFSPLTLESVHYKHNQGGVWKIDLKLGLMSHSELWETVAVLRSTGELSFLGMVFGFLFWLDFPFIHQLNLGFKESKKFTQFSELAVSDWVKWGGYVRREREELFHRNFRTASAPKMPYMISPQASRKGFKVSKTLLYYFERVLELANSARIKVYVENIPINQPTFERLQRQHVVEFRVFMEELQKKFPNIVVNTELTGWPVSLFRDPDHLTEQGGKKLAELYKAKIKIGTVRQMQARKGI